jgi:hypothetical protein
MFDVIDTHSTAELRRWRAVLTFSYLLQFVAALALVVPFSTTVLRSHGRLTKDQIVNIYVPAVNERQVEQRRPSGGLATSVKAKALGGPPVAHFNAAAVQLAIEPDTARQMLEVLRTAGGSIGFAEPDSPEYVFAMFSAVAWSRVTDDVVRTDQFFCIRIHNPGDWPEVRKLQIAKAVSKDALVYALFPPTFRGNIDRQLEAASIRHAGKQIAKAVIAFRGPASPGIAVVNVTFGR